MIRLLTVLVVLLLIGCSSKQDQQRSALSKKDRKTAERLGESMVKIAFKSLSGELKNQISSNGVDSAIYACQLKANPILDSIAKANNVSIQRITRYPRNPLNAPSKNEKQLIKLLEKAKSANQELRPITFLIDTNTIAYYQPILINPLCLNCHGEPGITMQESTFEIIKKAYPKDKAFGYKIDDLRGLWAVKFDKSILKD